MAAEREPDPGRELPEHRQYTRYLEQYCANSLSEAVSEVEAWAARVLGGEHADDEGYPSPGWIARQFRTDLFGARNAVAQGDAHRAAWYALRVGELIAEAHHLGYLDDPDDIPLPDAPPENSATP
jgi:hypothetical protein